MTIKREIDGKQYEFQLTDTELYLAFSEQQFQYDQDDVRDVLWAFDDDDLSESYGVTRAEFESLVGEMAVEMRRNIDKYDMSWQYARDEAVSEITRRYKEAS